MLELGFEIVFDPTDEELIKHLKDLKDGKIDELCPIREMNIYSCVPWRLPHSHHPLFRANEWFYFCKLERASSARVRRTVQGGDLDLDGGTWKALDGDRDILSAEDGTTVVGVMKNLNFVVHKKRMEDGKVEEIKTDWVMKEVRLSDSDPFQDWAVCRIRFSDKGKTLLSGASRQQIQSQRGKKKNRVYPACPERRKNSLETQGIGENSAYSDQSNINVDGDERRLDQNPDEVPDQPVDDRGIRFDLDELEDSTG